MSTQMSASQFPSADKVETKLEVVIIPVSDVDRAKRFYEGLGWRLDGDFASGTDWRVVQLTPPGSPCSISSARESRRPRRARFRDMFLVVDDIEAARAELVGRGVDVSEVFHFEGGLHVDGTKGARRARTRKVAPTAHGPHSAIRTATAGCSRRSRRGFPDEGSAWTSRL